MIRVKSVSSDGTYYLVNGWRKHRAYWHNFDRGGETLFKDIKTAKASLTKLLKIMPEYATDKITFEEED